MKPLDDVQIREILESGRPARNRVAVVAVHALRTFMQIGLAVAVQTVAAFFRSDG